MGERARTPDKQTNRQTDTESDNKGHLELSGAREPTDRQTDTESDNKGHLELSGAREPTDRRTDTQSDYKGRLDLSGDARANKIIVIVIVIVIVYVAITFCNCRKCKTYCCSNRPIVESSGIWTCEAEPGNDSVTGAEIFEAERTSFLMHPFINRIV